LNPFAASGTAQESLPVTAEDDASVTAGERALRLAAAEHRAEAAAASRSTMDDWRQQRSGKIPTQAEEPTPAFVQPQPQPQKTMPSEEAGLTPEAIQMQATTSTPAEQWSSPANPVVIVVGSVLPFEHPPAEVVEDRDRTRWPKTVASVLCCLSGLFFTVAIIIVVKHHGDPGYKHHSGVPWMLAIILLSAAMLCGTAILINLCRKRSQGPQRGQVVEDGQGTSNSKYPKGAAFACCFLGILLVTFALLALTSGHNVLHRLQLHHSSRALYFISKVCLLSGFLCIAASIILCSKKTSSRTQPGQERSSCRKRALVILSIVLSLLLVSGVVLAAENGRGSRRHHHRHYGSRPHYHGHNGPTEWQTMSDSIDSSEDWAEDETGSAGQEGDDEGDDDGPESPGKDEGEADEGKGEGSEVYDEGDDEEGLGQPDEDEEEEFIQENFSELDEGEEDEFIP